MHADDAGLLAGSDEELNRMMHRFDDVYVCRVLHRRIFGVALEALVNGDILSVECCSLHEGVPVSTLMCGCETQVYVVQTRLKNRAVGMGNLYSVSWNEEGR